jgi:hypothetical protein
LESATLGVTLSAEVFPLRGEKQQSSTQGLSARGLLEEEGRARLRGTKSSGLLPGDTPNYHAAGTTCALRASLAVPIPAVASLQAEEEELLRQKWNQSEKPIAGSSIWCTAPPEGSSTAEAYRAKVSLPAVPAVETSRPPAKAAKPPPKKGSEKESKVGGPPNTLPALNGEVVECPWRRCREAAEQDQLRVLAAMDGGAPQNEEEVKKTIQSAKETVEELCQASMVQGLDCEHERYGRVVIVVDLAEKQIIDVVLRTVRVLNARAFGFEASGVELFSYVLTERERADPHLDILTGFTVLDEGSRLMVVEGLANRGLKELLQAIPRTGPNDAHFKLLHNSKIGYGQRLYNDFGLTLKAVKLRTRLERLVAKPEMYNMKGNLGEDTLAGIEAPKLLIELRHGEKAHLLRKGGSFPSVTQIRNLEILFAAPITDAELGR